MTKLYFINYYILQWFFVRLTRHRDKIIGKVDWFEISITPNGYEPGGTIKEWHYEEWYSIQYWVWPLSGWKDKFKYTKSSPNFLRLTKNKIVEA